MIIGVNEIRVGHLLRFENAVYRVLDAQHVKPGKGGAYMQLEMKDVAKGTKITPRLRSSETIEKVTSETKNSEIMFVGQGTLTIMNPENYEQEEYDMQRYCGDFSGLMEDGMRIKMHYIDDELVLITPEDTIVAPVLDTEPYIKGATVTGSFKPAFIKGGVRVMVPQYIEIGEKIIIKTETLEFVERAK